MPEPRVFISYHRADLATAERVRAHLLGRRCRIWMDQYNIPPGAYWPDEIDRGLGAADFVVGILSPDAVRSDVLSQQRQGRRGATSNGRPCLG